MFVTDRAPRQSWSELLDDAPHTRRRIRTLPANAEIVDAGSSRLDEMSLEETHTVLAMQTLALLRIFRRRHV